MVFTAQLPPDNATGGPSFRQWGSCSWWQNTRLAYWSFPAAQDYAELRTIFEYYLQMAPLLQLRTAAAFNHSGLYVTETKTLFGAYDPCGVPTCHSNPGEADGYFTHDLLIARSGPVYVSGQTTTATRAAT
jgi:hypothetical protein